MRFLALIVISLFFTVGLNAQLCTPQTVTFPITPTSTLQYTPSYSSGVILFPFTATAGCTYTFSTCGQSSIDTYLRLHNSSYTLLGQWDDQCALQSTFTWTCPAAGQYYVHLSKFVCAELTAATTMSYVVSCPTPPCNNPIVNAGPDVVVCAGQPSTLNGTVTAGTGTGSGGSSSSITITISGTGFLDETSWNLTNASGATVGSGGPYIFASNNTITLTNVGTGPYNFSMETQGNFNDNNASYTISCNSTTVNTGSITGGQTTTASVTGCNGTTGGGTLPITYVWSPGATLSSTTILNPTATPTVTTTYTLTATSGTCTSTDEMTVFVSPAPTINAGPDITICTGQTTTLNGSASAVGGFGGPIDVNIFSGSNLDETTWNITNSLGAVIASGGPYASGSNQTITINAPSNPPYTFNLETQGAFNSNVAGYNIFCGSTSISGGLAILTGGQTIAVPISGCPGSIPTTLSWSPGATLSSTTVANPIASPTSTTTYTLTATANGCTSNDDVVVNVVPGPTVTVNNATICGGQTATLTATTTATGGTYLWSPGGATTQTIDVSPATTTSYTVTYSNGNCSSAPATGVVTVSASPTLSVNSSTICQGASATLTATASPSGGTYLWTPGGATTQTLTISPTTTTTYSVTYSLNGCSSSSANGTVTVSNVIDWANIQTPGGTTICQGQTLTIYGQVFEAGVTPPAGQGAGITVQYAYNTSNTNPATWPTTSWTAASYNAPGTGLNNDQYTGVIPALSPGTYYYSFSYTMNGCTSYGGFSAAGGGFWNGTTNVNGTLVVNPNVAPTFNPISAVCAGGALNALPTTSLNSISGSWSPALNNQTTTTYTFTPATGWCVTTTALTITVNPLPIAAISIPTTSILTCTTQSITLSATGGGTYSWSNGTAIIGTTSTINVTSPGTYSVTVTSSSGCTATASQVITQNISLPVVGISAPTTTVLTCATTSISLTATGGGSYSWSNGTAIIGTTSSITVNTPGIYTVSVTGANGCTASAVQNITQNISAPNVTITPPTTTILTCTATNINLIASGGSYSWSNGTSVVGTSAILAVSVPGTYTVTVTGGNGCTGTANQTITQNITAPVAGINSPATTVLTCTTPSISLTATGGGTYSWSNGTSVVGTNSTLNVTTPGTYTVTVTAANGCTATATQTITQNNTAPPLTITAPISTELTCSTTSISLTANGVGTISWTNPSIISVNPSITVTTPGVYTVTLTAANGCTASLSQTITQNTTAPAAAITAPSTTVLTCSTTSITLTATGGGTYSWSNGTTLVGTNAALVVTTPGIYTVTVTGTNGCTATAATTITQNTVTPSAGINIPSTTILTCTTPTISLTATGGGTYSWSNGTSIVGSVATLSVTTPGTYTVTVTAPNGCTATANQVITQNIVTPTVSITNNTNATVLDCNTTQISLTGVGGTTASWSNGTTNVSTTAALTVTTAGTYTYTGTNANGCFDTESITITFTPNTNPTFTQIAAICTNGSFTLPTTSTNNVAGTWSPAPNYTTTTTYTFQPNAGLCANTASMTITVHPYPVVTTQNDTICIGQSTTINTTVNLTGGTYLWSPTNANTPSISVSPLTTTNYQLIYSLNGCATANSVEIYVKPVSTPVTSNQTICNGQTAELIATTPLAGGTFIWSNGVQNDTIQVSPSATTTYSVAYNLNGCLSPIVNSIVSVNPVPTLGVNNSTICAGDNATITAIPNLLGGTFYWGTPGIIGAASQTISPLNDTTLSVYYTLNGCTSPVTISSITVNPLPIATFSASVTQGCAPLLVTLTADDASNATYNWTTSNSLTGTGIQTNLQFQMNGGFDVALTTTLNGCTVTETVTNYIQVDNYPIAAFEPSSTMFSEPNQTLNFMNNSLGASTYAWEFGDGGTSSEEGPNHTFAGNELGFTIVLTAISNLGCIDTAQYFIGYDPGLVYYIPNSFTPDGDMNNQVFNPVFTSGIDIYHYTMYIYNRWGEVIFESNDPSIGWDGSYGVKGKDAEVGVYTYQIFIKIPTFDERKMILGQVNLIR